MKSKLYAMTNSETKIQIQTISKPATILKCSIFLFVLSISMCLLEDVDMNTLISTYLKF